MKTSRAVQELFAIASISAGSGLLLHPLLAGLTHLQQWAVLGGSLAMVAAYTIKQRGKRRAGASAVRLVQQVSQSQSKGFFSFLQTRQQGNRMNEMNRYFAWIEKKLEELIEREGLHCALVRMKRGPLVITLQLRLVNPTQRELHKLMRLGPAIAQLLQVESIRIADSAQGIMVELPSPAPLTPNGVLLARYTKGLTIAVGVDSAARPVLVNLEDHGALFWVGPSRSGKTQSMKSALYAVLQANPGRVWFVIFATPAKVQEDWEVFQQVTGCLGIASNKEDIQAATTWLIKVMNGGEVRAKGLHIIAIYDDLPKILKAIPDLSADISDLASLGAGLGVHLWAGTQGAGSKRTSGGSDVENNVTARILYRPATARSGSQGAGVSGLSLDQLSSQKGDALALIHGMATRIATAWISDRDILLLPEGKGATPPWQRNGSQAKPSQNRSSITRTGFGTSENQPNQTWNQVKPVRTTQNQGEPPVTCSDDASCDRYTNNFASCVTKPVLEPGAKLVLEPLANQTTGIEGYVRHLTSLTNEELRLKNLAFDGSRLPTPDEQHIIALAFAISNSLNKTCRICYGYKNPKVVGYVKTIVGDAASEMATQAEVATVATAIPDTVDLSAEPGRETLVRLQANGVIHWSNIDNSLGEGEYT